MLVITANHFRVCTKLNVIYLPTIFHQYGTNKLLIVTEINPSGEKKRVEVAATFAHKLH